MCNSLIIHNYPVPLIQYPVYWSDEERVAAIQNSVTRGIIKKHRVAIGPSTIRMYGRIACARATARPAASIIYPAPFEIILLINIPGTLLDVWMVCSGCGWSPGCRLVSYARLAYLEDNADRRGFRTRTTRNSNGLCIKH